MVVRQSQVIDGPDHDLSVFDHRTIPRCMHPQNRRLGRVDDRGGQHRSEHAAVGYREGASGQLVDRQAPLRRPRAVVGDTPLDLGEAELIGVAQDRHHQPPRGPHRDADVEIAVVDDLGAVHRSVDDRIFLQRRNRGLHEERHEAELHAVLPLEPVLVAAAQLDQRPHVHFIERGQDRRRRLRLHQALGDALAQARHRYTLLRPSAEQRGVDRGFDVG